MIENVDIQGYLAEEDDGNIYGDFYECMEMTLDSYYPGPLPSELEIVSYVRTKVDFSNISVMDNVWNTDIDIHDPQWSPLNDLLEYLDEEYGPEDSYMWDDEATISMINAEGEFIKEVREKAVEREISFKCSDDVRIVGGDIPEEFIRIEKKFLKVVEDEYVPWRCDKYETEKVDVVKWIREERPDWNVNFCDPYVDSVETIDRAYRLWGDRGVKDF